MPYNVLLPSLFMVVYVMSRIIRTYILLYQIKKPKHKIKNSGNGIQQIKKIIILFPEII